MWELDGNPMTEDAAQALALRGYGHFTTFRLESGAVRGLDSHLARLTRDARLVFGAHLDPDRVREYVRRVGAQGTSLVRVTIFDPDLGLEYPGADAHPRVLVSTRPAPPLVDPPPVTLQPRVFGRYLPEVKHTAIFGALYERRLAQRSGADDAVFTDEVGLISEGPTWNIALVTDEAVIAPLASSLAGVTQELLRGAPGLPWREAPVSIHSLDSVRAALITSSGSGVRPVARIGQTVLDVGHPVFATMREHYLALPPQEV